MADPFKRGPRRMFPTAPEVAPSPVVPATPSWDDPPVMNAATRAMWDNASRTMRADTIATASGELLDMIGQRYSVRRNCRDDASFRIEIEMASDRSLGLSTAHIPRAEP